MSLLDNLFPVTGPIEPHTDDWYAARLGRITASDRASRMLSKNTGTLNNLLAELRYELSSGEPYREWSGNRHTAHGHRFEKQAFSEYEMQDLDMVDRVYEPGFMVHPECQLLGATPDFLEGDDYSGQIKCPSKPGNHLRMWINGMDTTFRKQVHCEALVTGRSRIVFISYDPRAVPAQQLYFEKFVADPNICERMLARAKEIEILIRCGGLFADPVKLAVETGVPNLF